MRRFVEDYTNANRSNSYTNGPVNGLSEAAQLINVEIHLANGELCLTTPDRITVPLNYDNKGYYNFVVREAIKRAIVNHLQQRTTNNVDKSKPHFRKDMVGITTEVDIAATLANFSYKPSKKGKERQEGPRATSVQNRSQTQPHTPIYYFR